MKFRKYGSPHATTTVRPAAVFGLFVSTCTRAFSSFAWAFLRLLASHFWLRLRVPVRMYLYSGGSRTSTPLSVIATSPSTRYCSSWNDVLGAASARVIPPASWSTRAIVPAPAERAAALFKKRRRLVTSSDDAMTHPSGPASSGLLTSTLQQLRTEAGPILQAWHEDGVPPRARAGSTRRCLAASGPARPCMGGA